MTTPGEIAPRRDVDHEMYVVVLSSSIHLAAGTGRVIVCPFIPGAVPEDTMAMVVTTSDPAGVVLPELVQWLPAAALDDPIGSMSADALRRTVAMMTALVT